MSSYVRKLVTSAVLLAVMPSTGSAAGIADFLSAPIPDAPVAASQAPVIAWVAKERGVRNVWLAEAPAFEPRQLTRYTQDDGQLIGNLQLNADGKRLAFVRGGTPDASGQANNPDSDPDGAEQAVWIVGADGKNAPRRIEAGRAALFAPGGNAVLVQTRSGPVCVPVAEAVAPPAWCQRDLLKLKGGNTAQAFSPDGQRLLFTSDRGDHAFVGVLDLRARSVQWIGPDFANDRNPVWSPDGNQVAFLRMGTRRPGETFRIDAAEPFEVWIGDASTGQARRVHRSDARAGGYAQFSRAQPLQWMRDGRLLFAAEADGWMRWYALDTDAAGQAAPVPLTPERCETDDVAHDGSGALFFSGNCEGLQHRQLFVREPSTNIPRRLTPVDGIATEPLLIAGGEWLAFRYADARLPTAITIMRRAETPALRRVHPARLPEQFPLDDLVLPQHVSLRAKDGFASHGQLFVPRETGRHPALVYVHGGPTRQIVAGWHPMDYYYHDYANLQWLASQGFVVLALNFRAGTGYGQDFRLAPDQGPRGASEYADVLAAHEYLAGRDDVDARRIGIYGGSYGGYLTSLALARDSQRFAAGVDRHGVHDWRESAKGGDNSGLWGLQPAELERAGASSPITRIQDWRSPVLVIHGDDDPAVLFAQSTNLVTALRRQGVPVETLVLPGEHHFFLRHATWLQVHERTLDFFRRHLRNTP